MHYLQRLVQGLREEGTVVVDGHAPGEYCLVNVSGREFDPPAKLFLGERELEKHLSSMASDAAFVFPSVAPIEAAYRLFVVHIDEVLATAAIPGSEIRLVNGNLRADPARKPTAEEPPGDPEDLVWMSHPPSGDPDLPGREV